MKDHLIGKTMENIPLHTQRIIIPIGIQHMTAQQHLHQRPQTL